MLDELHELHLFDSVIELAVAAEVDYADLISEPNDAQRRAVADAGITAISGLGASPGLTNVLVRHAADWLDDLEEAHLSWASFRTIAPGQGLLDTILWELSDDCPTRRYFSNGRYVRAGFMEGSRLVDFAAPLGRQRVYYVPHPEVATLPRNFPSLRFCAVRGTWRPELMEHVRVLNEYGLLDAEAIEATKSRIWARKGGLRDDDPWRLFVNVEVVGTRGGEAWRRVYDASPSGLGPGGHGEDDRRAARRWASSCWAVTAARSPASSIPSSTTIPGVPRRACGPKRRAGDVEGRVSSS